LNGTGLNLNIDDFAIELHREFPGVVAYTSRTTGDMLCGAEGPQGFQVVVLDREAGLYRSSSDPELSIAVTAVEGSEAVSYLVSASIEGLIVAKVDVQARTERRGLCLRSEIVEETPGFEVQAVVMQVLRVPREAPGAAMAFANRCGRLIDLSIAPMEKVEHYVDWYEAVPVAIVNHDGMAGVLSLDTADCQFSHEVRPGEGSVSVELLHRHRCDHPANSFLAQRVASCLLRFAVAPAGGKVDWTAGAAILRDEVPAHVQDLYVDSLVYKVLLQVAHAEEVTTYDDVWELIQRVHRLSGGNPQVVYLIGWQHHGHDTGYPDVYTPNARVGTYEEFQALKEKAKALNAIVSLHDNYHDTYVDSPLWDPSIVCVNPDGELRKGGIWGGGQAYEIGPTKYLSEALRRVERTVKMMGLEKTTHLDVLSDKPNMVDFDVENPANREQNAAAKRLIVEGFRKFGVDVTSEVLTSPFTPWMHHFWHAVCAPGKEWKPEERIPLVPFIYHGKVTAGGEATTDEGILDRFYYGLSFSTDWSKETPDSEIMDCHYLVYLPWAKLARRGITGFERSGGWDKVCYGPTSYVRVNRCANRYEMVVDGVPIASDYGTCVERSPGEWLVYTREPREFRLPFSGAFTATPVGGQPAAESRGAAVFKAEARVPYRLTVDSL
jgi:hypothetical protein